RPATSWRWSGRSGVRETGPGGAADPAQVLSRDGRQGPSSSERDAVVSGSAASWVLSTRISSSSSESRRSTWGSLAGVAARDSSSARMVGFTPILQAMAAVMSRVEAPMNRAATIWATSVGSKGMPSSKRWRLQALRASSPVISALERDSELVGGGEEDEDTVFRGVRPGQVFEVEVRRDDVGPLPPPPGDADVGPHVLGVKATGEGEPVVVHVRGVVHVHAQRVAGGEVGEGPCTDRE